MHRIMAIMSVLRIFFRIRFWCIPLNTTNLLKRVKKYSYGKFSVFRLNLYDTLTLHIQKETCVCQCTYTTDMPSIYWRHTEIAPVYWNVIETHRHRYVSNLWRTHTTISCGIYKYTRALAIQLNWTEQREEGGKKMCMRNHFGRVFCWIFFLLFLSCSRFDLLLFLFFILFFSHLIFLFSFALFFFTWCVCPVRIQMQEYFYCIQKLNEW